MLNRILFTILALCQWPEIARAASGPDLERGAEGSSRTQLELSPQVVYFRASGLVFQIYGSEFGVWQRVQDGFDAGASLRQAYSFANGGAAVLSTLCVKGRWHLTGGRSQSSERWLVNGGTAVIIEQSSTGGFHLDPSLEQVTFNTPSGGSSYSAMGILLGYDLPIAPRMLMGLGVGASRMVNGQRIVVPIRAALSIKLNI